MRNLTKPAHALAVALLAFTVLPGAKGGCGTEEANETRKSPVQAITTLLERSGGKVEAELVLISTATNPHAFVETAIEPRVRVPGGAEVALTQDSPGHYTASSESNPDLTYIAGERYQFRFELDDAAAAKQVAGGTFVAVVTAPDDTVEVTLDKAPDFAGDTAKITWTPTNRFGLFTATKAGGDTAYTSFDFADPQFDGDKWARLRQGGTLNLSVDTFNDPGNYTLSFCAVDKVSDFDTALSAELGALSGFVLGRCAEDITLTVLE